MLKKQEKREERLRKVAIDWQNWIRKTVKLNETELAMLQLLLNNLVYVTEQLN